MNAHRALLLGLGLFGACATQWLRYRFMPLSEMLRWETWQSPWIAGATAGALSGHLLWVVAKPWQRMSRAIAVCLLANIVVWLSFLVFTPPIATSEFRRIEVERVQRDAEPGHMEFVTDQPIVVAGRWHGTFGAVNGADWLLSLFAAPAIGFAELLVVPPRYIGIDATRGESFVIAGLGFVLSTAFWATFGTVGSALTRKSLHGTGRPSL